MRRKIFIVICILVLLFFTVMSYITKRDKAQNTEQTVEQTYTYNMETQSVKPEK